MALPVSRRLPELDEDSFCNGTPGGPNGPKISLKLKVNKLKVFFETMASWYQNKSPKQRKRVFKKDVIRRARAVASNLRMNYDKLPRTWLRTLHETHSVDFRWRDPAEKAKRKAIKLIRNAGFEGKLNFAEMKKMVEEVKSGELTAAEAIRQFGSASNSQNGEEKTEYFDLDELNHKFVDLTKSPPPDFWTAAYIKGILLPRELKVVYVEEMDQTVIYYDYAPRIQPSDGSELGTPMVHDANNFLSWRY